MLSPRYNFVVFGFSDQTGLSIGTAERLAAELSVETSLASVIQWGLRQAPECMVVDVVVQDEYTHDVIMGWSEGRHLVFDTT